MNYVSKYFLWLVLDHISQLKYIGIPATYVLKLILFQNQQHVCARVVFY